MAAVPVYLFTGPEAGEKNDAIQELRVQARKRQGALDEHTFYAAETRVADVVELLLNESLFASARFVVLNCAEQIKKKEDIGLLESWVRSARSCAGSASTLVLVSDENSCDKKLESLVPKENRRVFWEMFDNRKEQWLTAFFRKNGYSVSPDAAELILDMVENNTEALRSECSRFFMCFEKGRTVTADDVERFLSHNREESAFTLFGALCEVSRTPSARLETALGILAKLRMSKESSGIQLVAGLTYCFRRLRAWHELLRSNPRPSDFDLRTNGFASKKAQGQYRDAARLWDARAVPAVLASLARTDMDLRSSGAALEDTVLTLLLYSIVFKGGGEVESYQEAL